MEGTVGLGTDIEGTFYNEVIRSGYKYILDHWPGPKYTTISFKKIATCSLHRKSPYGYE
jgi:hypothetical protein